MSNQDTKRSLRGLRRSVYASLVMGLLATLLVASPASATDHSKWAPAIRVFAHTNDDGRPGPADPGDIGGTSSAYDRWGLRSSDDPIGPGMDANRIDSDVARCKARSIDRGAVRVTIWNAYPGYTCTFRVVTINRAGVKLVVDDVWIGADDSLELVELEAVTEGDVLKRRRRHHGTYAVTALQEAPQGDTLEFEIEISYINLDRRRPPPKCCLHCWR